MLLDAWVIFSLVSFSYAACPSNWVQNVVDGQCYLVVKLTEPASYLTAATICRSQGALLPSAASPQDNNFLKGAVAWAPGGRAWLGVQYDPTLATQVFEDGTPMAYSNTVTDTSQLTNSHCLAFTGSTGVWEWVGCLLPIANVLLCSAQEPRSEVTRVASTCSDQRLEIHINQELATSAARVSVAGCHRVPHLTDQTSIYVNRDHHFCQTYLSQVSQNEWLWRTTVTVSDIDGTLEYTVACRYNTVTRIAGNTESLLTGGLMYAATAQLASEATADAVTSAATGNISISEVRLLLWPSLEEVQHSQLILASQTLAVDIRFNKTAEDGVEDGIMVYDCSIINPLDTNETTSQLILSERCPTKEGRFLNLYVKDVGRERALLTFTAVSFVSYTYAAVTCWVVGCSGDLCILPDCGLPT